MELNMEIIWLKMEIVWLEMEIKVAEIDKHGAKIEKRELNHSKWLPNVCPDPLGQCPPLHFHHFGSIFW